MPLPVPTSAALAHVGRLHIAYLAPSELAALTQAFQGWYDAARSGGVQRRTRGRYWLAFLVLRYTGARLGEVLLLDDRNDMDTRAADLRLPTLKRRGDEPPRRIVPVPPSLMAEVATYLLDWPAMRGQVFGIEARNFRREFAARAREAGILRQIRTADGRDRLFPHPHTLRHTRAIELLTAGVPVTAVQDLLGHSSLLTTAEYLRLSCQDIKNILRDKGLI